MKDYEKFDEYLNDGKFQGEFGDLHKIADRLKNQNIYPSPMAENRSKNKFLAAAESMQAEQKTRRVRRLGAVFAWAVPAVLILVLAGIVFGNGPGSGNQDIQTGVGGELEQDDGILQPAEEITPTRIIITNDGPASTPIPAEIDGSNVITPTQKDGETITVYDEDGNPVELINPAVPVNGGAGQPVDTQEGQGQSDSTGGAPPDQ